VIAALGYNMWRQEGAGGPCTQGHYGNQYRRKQNCWYVDRRTASADLLMRCY